LLRLSSQHVEEVCSIESLLREISRFSPLSELEKAIQAALQLLSFMLCAGFLDGFGEVMIICNRVAFSGEVS